MGKEKEPLEGMDIADIKTGGKGKLETLADLVDLLQDVDFGFVHQILTFTRRHNETMTTFSRRFDTYRIDKLATLKKYADAVGCHLEIKFVH